MYVYTCICINEPVYKLEFVSIEDSDQPAHPHSLIRVFDERSMGSQWVNVSSGKKTDTDQTALIHSQI